MFLLGESAFAHEVPVVSQQTTRVYTSLVELFFCCFSHDDLMYVAAVKARVEGGGYLILHFRCSISILFCLSPSYLLSPPFVSCSLLVVTQIRGHIVDSLPTTVCALNVYSRCGV